MAINASLRRQQVLCGAQRRAQIVPDCLRGIRAIACSWHALGRTHDAGTWRLAGLARRRVKYPPRGLAPGTRPTALKTAALPATPRSCLQYRTAQLQLQQESPR